MNQTVHLINHCCCKLIKPPKDCVANSSRPRPVKASFQNEQDEWTSLKKTDLLKPEAFFGELGMIQQERESEKTKL